MDAFDYVWELIKREEDEVMDPSDANFDWEADDLGFDEKYGGLLGEDGFIDYDGIRAMVERVAALEEALGSHEGGWPLEADSMRQLRANAQHSPFSMFDAEEIAEHQEFDEQPACLMCGEPAEGMFTAGINSDPYCRRCA